MSFLLASVLMFLIVRAFECDQKFGFASCTRNVGAAEGVNVLTEQSRGDGSWEYAISCIEYTEFSKLGITDVPVAPGRYDETSIDCPLIVLSYFGGQTPKLPSASHPHVILEQCVFQFDLLAIYWMSPQH